MSRSGEIVRHRSLQQAWRKAEGLDFWVLLETPSTDFDAFTAAVEYASHASSESGHEDPLLAEVVSPAPDGFVVLVTHSEVQATYEEWLNKLEQALLDAGLAGTLTSPADPPIPPWMLDTRPPEPTGFFLWSLGDTTCLPEVGFAGRWRVPGPQTRSICAVAERVRPERADATTLQHGSFRLALSHAPVASMLEHALARETVLGMEYTSHELKETVRFSLGVPNGSAYQIIGVGTDAWARHVDAVRQVLVSVAGLVEVAFIRSAVRGVLSSSDIDSAVSLPDLREYHVRYNPHLLGSYTPDANGVQVLTTRHLERARRLDEWRITDLGGDRHLVEATDLTPWYGASEPDPGVLAQARSDFGDMLLSTDVIEAHPPPWQFSG